MAKSQKLYRSTIQHWLSLIFVITALTLLSRGGSSGDLKLLLAAVGGVYVVWNVWHHSSKGSVRFETFLEYSLVALITWFVVSSVM